MKWIAVNKKSLERYQKAKPTGEGIHLVSPYAQGMQLFQYAQRGRERGEPGRIRYENAKRS
jgi:hypothetical protein